MPTSSGAEDSRYLELKSKKNIKLLVRQLVFRARINEVDVFRYTADFAYLEDGIKIIEEFKGYIHERHDYELRIKVISALYPELTFRVYLRDKQFDGIWKIFKAGKIVRFKRPKSFKKKAR